MRAPGLPRLVLVLAVTYLACATAAAVAGVGIALPWHFLLLLGIVALPVARTITLGADAIASRASQQTGAGMARVRGCGLVAVFFFRLDNVVVVTLCLVLLIAHLGHAIRSRRDPIGTLALGVLALWLGYAAVWCLNYLIVAGYGPRSHDALIRRPGSHDLSYVPARRHPI